MIERSGQAGVLLPWHRGRPLTRISLRAPERLTADVLVAGWCEGDQAADLALPPALTRTLAEAVRAARFGGERDRVLHLGDGRRRLTLLGAGPRRDFARPRL